MKNALPLALLATLLLVGCSGGSEPTAKESAEAQSGFSRPLNDAEKARMGGETPTSGAATPPAKTPAGN